MLRTNYRCVQSFNISVDVAKREENVQTLIHYTHFWTVTKNDLSSLNYLFMERFVLNRMSTSVKNKLQMCSVTQHQCRWRQMCGKCSQIHQVHSLLSVLVLIEQAKFQLTRMSSYAKNKLQMCSVTQNQCRRRQMCGKCSHINSLHSLLDCHKNDLSSQNNLFMANFQLIRMSSCDTNKLQMCSVCQHQCRRRQMCGKVSQIHPDHSLFVRYKKRLVLIEQSIHGKVSTQ